MKFCAKYNIEALMDSVQVCKTTKTKQTVELLDRPSKRIKYLDDLCYEMSSIGEFDCDECNRSYGTKEQLLGHIQSSHTVEDSAQWQCDRLTVLKCTQTELYEAQWFPTEIQHQVDTFSCKNCGQTFNNANSLKLHLLQTSVECLLCGFESSCDILHGKHELLKHRNGYESWRCDVCNQSFGSKFSLIDHVHKYSHRQSPSSPETSDHESCIVNDVKTPSKEEIKSGVDSLSTLKTLYDQENPFKCDLCDHQFSSMLIIEKHVDLHHSQNFWCTACELKFSDEKALQHHLKKFRRKLTFF